MSTCVLLFACVVVTVVEKLLVGGSHPCLGTVVRILFGAAAAGLRCVVADTGRRGAVGAYDDVIELSCCKMKSLHKNQ